MPTPRQLALGAATVMLSVCGAQAAPVPGLESYATPQRLVRLPDGRRLNLFCTGVGSPTVILEAGWSNSSLAWRLVQPLIASWTRVCSYDRAGLGFSDPPRGPRDTASIAADLSALLSAAELPRPYLLVGYSMGAMSMRLLADQRLDDIAGMVLVEPSVEHQATRLAAAVPDLNGANLRPPRCGDVPVASDEACMIAEPPLPQGVAAVQARIAATPAYQATILAELAGMSGAGSAQVAASRRSYGSLPLVVVTAADNHGHPAYSPEQAAAFRRTWSAMHGEVAALSSRGVHRQVAGSTHLIVLERPQAVADAVREVARQAGFNPPH
jgi:pimeloyl-ACP methyl ester carboxylesterase